MNIPTSPLRPPLPPPPAAPADHSLLSESSPLLPILTTLAFVIIVVLIYVLFMVLKCPTATALSDRLRRISGVHAADSTSTQLNTNKKNVDQLVSSVEYNEAADDGKDSGGSECPVCLTAFVDGEVIREVNICKHLFHDSCIEMWISSHSNCPVCRVSVGTKRAKRPVVVGGGDEDFRQGLPDSASLV